MSRRIETGTPTTLLGENEKPSDYLGRLVGYIPAEIVALYVAANGVVPEKATSREVALWIIFAACGVLTPIVLWFATWDPKKGSLLLQVVLATIAFPVWAFAIGGPFLFLPWYQGWIASLVLFFVTFGFGIIKPKTGS